MTLGGHLQIDAIQQYLDGTLAPARRQALQVHLEKCDECRALLLAASSLATRSPPAPAPAELPTIPEEHYLIEREIARGGLGKILSARHIPLDRIVAVKELLRADDADHGRFVREALITAGLQHPGIVPVHEAGRWPSGEPFYAMKLVVGQSLQHVLEDSHGLDRRLALLPRLIAVGEALAYAHARGVIHRDIKPANILCGEYGETVLIDWGLAKRLDETGGEPVGSDGAAAIDQTAAGALVGTPRYMAPEQARGEPVDARADVYALGVVLYELLTGVSPYADEHGLAGLVPETLAELVAAGRIVPVRAREPDAPRDLATIAERALALAPDRRYPSAKAFVDDLQRFTTGQLISRRYTSGELARRWLRRNRTLAGVGAAALAALAILGGLSAARIARARHAAQDSLARLELDEGRLAYLNGDPLGSLDYLGSALRDGADGPVARYLVARALESSRPAAVLAAHAGGVYTVRFSPDGAKLATSGEDGAAIWDAASGAREHSLGGQRGAVLAAEWSPDGRRLVTAGLDGVVRVWDRDGKAVAQLEGHKGYVPGVRFSPDGARLASWDLFGGVRVWDLASGTARFALAAHAGRVAEVDFDAAGARLLSVGRDGQAKVWAADSGAPVCSTATAGEALVSAAFAPDGARFALGGSGGDIEVHAAADCRPILKLRSACGELSHVMFDPAGARMLTIGLQGTRMWDAATGELLENIEDHAVTQIAAFAAGGNRVATAGHDRLVHVWSTRDGRPLALFAGHAHNVRALSWSPDQRRLASASADGTVRIWAAERDAVARAPAGLRALQPQPDGTMLVVGRERGGVSRWDPARRAWSVVQDGVCPWSATTTAANLVCVLAGDRVLRTRDGAVELVDLASGAVRWRDPTPRVNAAALDAAAGLAAAVSAAGDVRVSDAATGAEVRTLHTGQHVTALAFAGGERLVTASPTELGVWQARTGAKLRSLPGAPLPRDVVILPVDRRRDALLVPRTDREVEIQPLSGAAPAPLRGLSIAVHDAAFSADGSLVATRHMDDAIRVWDTDSGVLVDVIRHGQLGDLAFVGDQLWTVDEAGELQTWPVARDERGVAAIERELRALLPQLVLPHRLEQR